MNKLAEKQIIEYLHRSYAAVDGLWFMMAESRFGFDTALDLDAQVWAVLPKIQARKIRELLNLQLGLDNLKTALTTKLTIDDFNFEITEDSPNVFTIEIKKCPWHELMIKSDRTDLSAKVGAKVCPGEYQSWAREFGSDIKVEIIDGICQKQKACKIRFWKE